MSILIASVLLTPLLVTASIYLIKRQNKRMALLFSFMLFLFSVSIVTAGMSGLRSHVEQERANGVSEEYINGMVERDWAYLGPRIAVSITIIGAFITLTFSLKSNKK
ncbi:MAG: hypothetical protein WDA70_01480 [Lysobacteraceae bacterium]